MKKLLGMEFRAMEAADYESFPEISNGFIRVMPHAKGNTILVWSESDQELHEILPDEGDSGITHERVYKLEWEE